MNNSKKSIGLFKLPRGTVKSEIIENNKNSFQFFNLSEVP